MKISNKKEEKRVSFADLSSRDKKKIIIRAVRKSNEEQLELIKKYDNICRGSK